MKEFIEELWRVRDTLGHDSFTQPDLKKAILDTIDMLDTGRLRAVTQGKDGKVSVNVWVKKAILMYLQITRSYTTNAGIFRYHDQIPMKFDGWDESRFGNAGVTVLPGAVVRKGAFIGAQSQIMPSFIDIGVRIGSACTIGSWTHIGACVQISDSCFIGHQSSIEGSLNSLTQPAATIEKGCTIGSQCKVGAGVVIQEGSELQDGVFIAANTRILDLETQLVTQGLVPPHSVVSPGTILDENGYSSSYAAIIIKRKG